MFKFIWILITCFLAFRCASPAKAPFIEKGLCPFECCQYGRWTARSPLVAYQEEGGRKEVFEIAPGDTFHAHTGNLHVDGPGIAVVSVAGNGFDVGDTVEILSYHGEGVYAVRHGNHLRDVEAFWIGLDEHGPQGRLVTEPRMIWWVNITDGQGRTGWLRLQNRASSGFELRERIDGMDACSG